MGRDGYSNFGFYNAFPADVPAAAAAGRTIDMRSFDTMTMVVNAHSLGSAGALGATAWKLVLQQGLASAAGVSAWSNVPLSQIIHSVEGGYGSTAEDGVFQILDSNTDAVSNITYAVGYKKDTAHRYIRLYLSVSGAASAMWLGAIAIAGLPGEWPVNEPV